MVRDLAGGFLAVVCHLGYVYAAGRFCRKYLGGHGVHEKLFMVFLFVGGIGLNAMGQRYAVPYILLAFLNHAFLIGLVVLLYEGDRGKRIRAASLLVTVTTLVENFCASLLSCFILFWQHTVKKIGVPFPGEWESLMAVCASLAMVILAVCGISKLVTFRFCFPALPLLAVTSIIDVANWGASHGILVRSGGNMGLYYDQMFSHAEFCILTLLSMFAAGAYVLGTQRTYLEQEKSSQYRTQIAAYKILEEQYTKSEHLRHDLKNHMIALRGLLDQKEWEKMGDYLKDMEESAGLRNGEENTGNRVVDVLLSQKRERAESRNIVWECNVRIPSKCCIHDFDLCVLFGNILDNAMEACERSLYGASHGDSTHGGMPQGLSQPFISIQAQAVKKCFLLEAKNSTDMEEWQKAGVTDRTHTKGHGIGLLNIRDVVHKYDGTMRVELEKGVFVISVLIPLNDAAHDTKRTI